VNQGEDAQHLGQIGGFGVTQVTQIPSAMYPFTAEFPAILWGGFILEQPGF
jgi:hypothetical protein